MSNTNPGANARRNFFRSAAFIGCRLVRSSSSNGDGGGSLSKSHKKRMSGKRKRQVETNGIQYSEVPQFFMTNPPTDLANPEEKIKLTDKPAPNTSVTLRP